MYNKSIFLDKAFQSYWFGWKKDLLNFFWNLLFNKWKICWMLSSFWRTTCHGAQLITAVTLVKITQTKPFILLKNEFTRKAWIAAINGKEGILPKNIYAPIIFKELLSLQAQSLVISFVYLTYHLTNIRTKLCTFCIWPTQSQRNNFQTTLHKVLF